MNDIKKVLIVAICVVLVIAIAAGVSIGVMANTMNGLKDRVEELDQAYASDVAAMKAEIEAAKAANENLVTAADFEAKLAAAIGEQNQTMQSLISTAVKNQIEDLEVEGLTEEQVNAIIDAAVANCLTEADVDAMIADIDTGLTKDEVKKLITNNTAGYLTYAQIANMIDDADYDLRAYLEKTLKAYTNAIESQLRVDLENVKNDLESDINTQAGKVASITLTTADANANNKLIIDADVLATLLSGGTLQLYTETWTAVDVIINYEGTMPFNLDGRNATIANLYVYAPNADIIVENLAVNGNVEVLQVPYNTLTFNNIIVKGNLVVEEGHVIVEDSTVENITVDGVANVSIGEDTTVETVVVTENAEDATVSNEGTVGAITVNADATVSNEGTVESIVVGNEDAVIENNGTVEDITGSGDLEGKYVTYDPEKDGSLDAYVEAAEDGAIIYIPAGEYTANQIDVKNSVSLIGIGDVVISGKQSNEHVILVNGTKDMIVNISNITIDYAGKAGIYVRTSTVNLDNVAINNCGWGAFQVDNSYTGDAVVVSIANSDIEKVALHSLTENAGKVDFTCDDTTYANFEIIEVNATDYANVTINGEAVDVNGTKSGVAYVVYTVSTVDELNKALKMNVETIYMSEGTYTISDQITIDGKSVNIIGLGDVVIGGDFSSRPNYYKVFYIYGSQVEGNKGINVHFENIKIETKNAKGDIWVRTWSNSCRGDINVTLKDVVCSNDASSILVDNNYSEGNIVNVDLENCTIGKITPDASPMNSNGINTYTNVTYDAKTTVKSINIQGGVEDLTHITINGVVPTEKGEQIK